MTKRKPPGQLKKRGPKAGRDLGYDHAADVWITVKLRQRRGDGDPATWNAAYALAGDLATNTSGTLSAETVRSRFYEAQQRRKKDPGYAAILDARLENFDRATAGRDAAESVIIPIFLNPDRN